MNTQPDTIKAELRREALARRDAIPALDRAVRSERLRKQVLALPHVRDAICIFAFMSHGSEVETHRLIDALLAAGKRVAVPLILPRRDDPGRRMLAVPIASRAELSPGVMGILSPPRPAVESGFTPDLVLTPGVAFARASPGRVVRLGYGGGYYDRYLARHPGVATVGLAFAEQVVASLPESPHDVPLQQLATC